MSNRYSSTQRFLRARNIAVSTITPGVDLTINAALFRTSIFNAYDSKYKIAPFQAVNIIDLDTAVQVKQIGVYSNFADGLIFKEPAHGFDVAINYEAFTRVAITPTALFTEGSKNVTLSANLAPSLAGYFIRNDVGQYYNVYSHVSGTSAVVLSDYSKETNAASVITKLSSLRTGQSVYMTNINQLNTLFDFDGFLDRSLIGGSTATDILLYANLEPFMSYMTHSIVFRTDTIDPAFTAAPVCFDIGITAEFTESPAP